MDAVNAKTLTQWTEGRLCSGNAETLFTRVCTDTRTVQRGDLFVALRGENFDGHAFVQDAAGLGAAGAIVEKGNTTEDGFVLVEVADTLKALQQMAANYRAGLDLKIVGITGSNGKTSTKDFTAAVLASKGEVLKTEGNLNNHIGVPLTLLHGDRKHQFAVVEIGMNHPGEIAPLAQIAAPGVAIITNIGIAHIEYMGTREAIALEKGMLAEALPSTGHLIQSAGDEFGASISKRSKATAVYAGIESGDVQGRNLREDLTGTHFTVSIGTESAEAFLPVPGRHMVQNALLAVAAGVTCGLSLQSCAAALADANLTKGRLQQKLIRGVHFLDDSYNANPDSVVAALETLGKLPVRGRRIAVLGRMNELGTHAESGHRRVGKAAAENKMDLVIGVGEGAEWITESAEKAGTTVQFAPSTEAAAGLLRDCAREGDVIVVKGSRSVRMENVIQEFARP